MNNSGVTLTDVKSEAFDIIQKLKSKEIDVQTAKEIRGYLDIVIQTAKTQIDFMNAIPAHIKEKMGEETIKAIAGTLRDRDAELDESITDIERRRNNYIPGKK